MPDLAADREDWAPASVARRIAGGSSRLPLARCR